MTGGSLPRRNCRARLAFGRCVEMRNVLRARSISRGYRGLPECPNEGITEGVGGNALCHGKSRHAALVRERAA